MNTVKKLALLFGVATGAAVTIMAFSKTGKKARNYLLKKEAELLNKRKNSDLSDDSDINYV